MRNPEQKMFLSVITQAITDAAYKGYDRYDIYNKDAASTWLVGNSKDFRLICQLADIDPDYAYHKFSKAIKNDITMMTRNHYKKQKHSGRYRLTFND